MGRSSSSCLKIIACGGSDKTENDDVDAPETKASSDKRGWSFRKRSGRHRVLGNNVGTETPTSAGKETPQGVNSDFQSPVKSTHSDEKPQLPRPVEKSTEVLSAMEHDNESKMSPVVVTSENGSSVNHTESKICQPVIASENPSHPTPDEPKTANLAVVLENDSNVTLAEPKVADKVVNSEIDGDTKSAEPNVEESVIVSENGDDADVTLDEPAFIIIQSAIRGFLARRAFVKLKSAIKLQAAVRGHLVRKNAIETLHCIRGIVKVQALVRARSSKYLDQKSKPNDTQFSTVKLLKNSYARQLLESTPKPKSVSIRCDPMKPNSSAWSWLERWMSVSTPEVAQESEPNLVPEDDTHVQETVPQADTEDSSIIRFYSVNSKFIIDEVPKELESEENHIVQDAGVADSQSIEGDDNLVQDSALQAEAEVPSIVSFYSVKSKFITDEVAESLEVDENHIVDDVNSIVDSPSCDPLLTEDKTEEITPLSTELIQEEVVSVNVDDALANEIPQSQEDPTSHEDEPPLEREPKLSLKRSASEELDGEGKKFMYVSSRKSSNPAFIAVQSKFEELSLAANPTRLVSLSNQDDGAKLSHVDTASSEQETVKKTNEPSLIEISPSSDPKIHIAASECGTELSISSTLDSPDRYDIGNTEAEKENKFLEETSCDPNNSESPNAEANGILGHIGTDLPSELAQQEDVHRDNEKLSVNQVESEISPQGEQKHEINASDLETNIEPVSSETLDSSPLEHKHEQNGYDVQVENDFGKEEQGTPQASPQSHMTMSESQGTPSSLVSVKGKKRNKNDKTESKAKRGSLSSGKWSPSKPSLDSGVRSSAEHLPKDHKKDGKRRNSFGSMKSDNADQEPRESSSSRNPLPSYMQATESARAKAQSPRSSPDVHEKEVSLKKRHSLPGASSGRQGSPHIQRLASQAAEGVKANGSSERKWQR